jgi:hypothetical protein
VPVYMPSLGGHPPHAQGFVQGDSSVFLYEIGYAYFGSETYHLMINMQCTPNGNEFMFGIATADRFKGLIANTFDSNVANTIIPKEHRPAVAKLLREKAGWVVRYMDKDSFFMVTYLLNLPEKALAKYDILTQVFTDHGYDVVQTEPNPGKHMWQMNREPVVPVDVVNLDE